MPRRQSLNRSMNRIGGLIHSTLDFDEIMQSESEKRFRTIFEGNTDGLLIAEAKSRKFLMGNRAICKMLGYQPEEIANLRVEDIHRPEDWPFVLEHFEKLASGKEGTGENIPVRRRDGSVFFADITANPIILSGQACLVGSFRDITERQKAFGELEHRARQLQRLTLELAQAEDRERRRLAEILHDDLQQVLAAAKFHLGLLHHRVRHDAEAKELADHLGKMLREAIEKSRSLSHELSPAVLYQSDLGETFEWLARQVQAKHGLTVHTEVHGRIDSPSEPIKAFLFRAAQEILFNAAKHAQVKEARLRLQRRRGQLWLTIADRGRGFDPQTLSQTSGFGLFSIRERVELLGGRMKIRSARGRGAVFLIVVDDGWQPEDRRQTTEDRQPGNSLSSALRPPSSVLRFPPAHPARR